MRSRQRCRTPAVASRKAAFSASDNRVTVAPSASTSFTMDSSPLRRESTISSAAACSAAARTAAWSSGDHDFQTGSLTAKRSGSIT
jgi:hypothetical protein